MYSDLHLIGKIDNNCASNNWPLNEKETKLLWLEKIPQYCELTIILLKLQLVVDLDMFFGECGKPSI